MFADVCKSIDGLYIIGCIFAGDASGDGCAADTAVDVAGFIACAVEPWHVCSMMDVNFQTLALKVWFIFGKFYHILAEIDALFVHRIEQGGVPFAFQPPAHIFHILRRCFCAVHEDWAGAVFLLFNKNGLPDIGGDIAELFGWFGYKWADWFALAILQHTDPGCFATALELLWTSVCPTGFNVAEGCTDLIPSCATSAGASRAVALIEHPAWGDGWIQAHTDAGGGNDGFGLIKLHRWLLLGNIDGDGADDLAAVVGQEFTDRRMVVDLHAALFGFLGENWFLLGTVVFEPDAHVSWHCMTVEFPVAVRTHLDAPFFPILDDLKAALCKLALQGAVAAVADEGNGELVDVGFDVFPVNLWNVAKEVVVAGGGGAATAAVGFFGDDDLGALVCGCDGRHEPGDPTTDDENITLFDLFLYFNHDLFLLTLHGLSCARASLAADSAARWRQPGNRWRRRGSAIPLDNAPVVFRPARPDQIRPSRK